MSAQEVTIYQRGEETVDDGGNVSIKVTESITSKEIDIDKVVEKPKQQRTEEGKSRRAKEGGTQGVQEMNDETDTGRSSTQAERQRPKLAEKEVTPSSIDNRQTNPTEPRRTYFYGQHSDERVLYVVREHPIAVLFRMMRAVLAGLLVVIGFSVVARTVDVFAGAILAIGWALGLVVGGGGAGTVLLGERKNIGYITDRRVVRFTAVTPWAVNTRSLTWDQAVKVKTFPRNFLYRLFNIGSVVIHAKSTVITSDEVKSKAYVSDDDVELKDVHYYRDLGNYVDKILYLYQRKPSELDQLKSFVAKPRGRRG